MKRFMNFVALTVVLVFPAAGSGLQSRDLPPVTWVEAPAHPPVEIVRAGRARAVVFVADPEPSPTLKRLVDELIDVVRLSSGATLERVAEPPAADRLAIVIGDCEESRRAGIDATKIPIEGFVVKTTASRDGVETVNMHTYLPLVRSGCSWPYKIKVHSPRLSEFARAFGEETKAPRARGTSWRSN